MISLLKDSTSINMANSTPSVKPTRKQIATYNIIVVSMFLCGFISFILDIILLAIMINLVDNQCPRLTQDVTVCDDESLIIFTCAGVTFMYALMTIPCILGGKYITKLNYSDGSIRVFSFVMGLHFSLKIISAIVFIYNLSHHTFASVDEYSVYSGYIMIYVSVSASYIPSLIFLFYLGSCFYIICNYVYINCLIAYSTHDSTTTPLIKK